MKRFLFHLIVLVLLDFLIAITFIFVTLGNGVLLEGGVYLLALEFLFGFIVHYFT